MFLHVMRRIGISNKRYVKDSIEVLVRMLYQWDFFWLNIGIP